MIIDFDTHILPKDSFDYMDARFEQLKPNLVFDDKGICRRIDFPGDAPRVPGATPLPGPGTGATYPGMCDVDNRIEVMDQLGIDRQVLVPQFQGFWSYLIDRPLAISMARSYNISIKNIVDRHPDRFIGGALIPLQDVEASVAELEWARDAGFKVIILDKVFPVTEHCFSVPLGSRRELWPFFQRVQELGMTTLLHSVTHGHRTTNLMVYQMDGLDIFATPEGHISMMSLVTSGLLDEIPDLKFVFTEAGTSFLEPLLKRFDTAFESPPVDYDAEDAATVFNMRRLTSGKRLVPFDVYKAKNKERPSDYFRRNFLFTIEPEEPGFAESVKFLGASQFLFATDYPHDDPGGRMKMKDVELLHAEPGLTADEKDMLFGRNALGLIAH